jgi:6-phosphofructokinase
MKYSIIDRKISETGGIRLTLRGNCLVAQSGGPTAVINNSLYGVICGAMESNHIESIFGAQNGVMGILAENFIDLKQQEPEVLAGLRHTPAAALGSCRYKVKGEDYPKFLEIFKKHNIRYFFYIGGNDSMDTVDKIHKLAVEQHYEMQVVGVPKTVDNDLPITDHCPGYGSAAKYIATVVKETGLDLKAMISKNKVTILEAMGRDTGWLAGASVLAKKRPEDAPHLIYLPESCFSIEQFVEDVKTVYEKYGYVYVVVSEGIRDIKGCYIAAESKKDNFGHPQLGCGLASHLKNVVEARLNISARYVLPSTSQRSSMPYASLTDIEEAYQVGKAAVKFADEGKSGIMATLDRQAGETYVCQPGYEDVSLIANKVKNVPGDWINAEGNFVTEEFIQYVRPLVKGSPVIPEEDGIPAYVRLKIK